MRRPAFFAIVCAIGCHPVGAPQPDAEKDVVAAVARELEALDHAVDLQPIAVEVREPQPFVEEVDGVLRLQAPDSFYAGMIAVREASGIEPTFADPAALRAEAAAARARNLLAFYDAQRRAIVLRADAPAESLDLHVARALVHAYQDQRMGGLVDSLYAPDARTDEARVQQCVLEGHASFVAAAMIAARKGVPPEQAEVSIAAPSSRPIAVEIDVPCPEGARFVRDAYRRAGWPAVLRAVSSPPPSTEMLRHPGKLDVDFPVNVAFPEWPEAQLGAAELVRDDTLGELAIERILLERGWPDARIAAVGWDGDRLQVWKLPSGATVVLWRSLWDREADGLQFRQSLTPKPDAGAFAWRVAHRGRLVQAVAAEDEAMANVLRDLLGGEMPPAEEPPDVASTIEAEKGGV